MLLEKFRELSQTWVAKVLLALIMVPFALFGVNYYFNQGGAGSNVVAKVAGESITLNEFNQTLRNQLDQMGQSAQDSSQLRLSILQALAVRHVMQGYANDIHLAVPNQLLANEIAQIPFFQDNGRFSQSKYESLLKERGLTPVAFENGLREDLKVGLVRDSLTATQWVPETTALAFTRLTGQQRTIETVNLGPQALAKPITISEDQARSYYAAHKEQFQVPEQVKVDYVVLSLADSEKNISLTSDDLKRAYADPANQKRWQTPESRRVSHILFAVPEKASQAEKEKQLSRAQQMAQYLRQHPKDFAKMAKENSQDPGSAKEGGDLGFFNQGSMVPAFEKAAFALKENQISEPVETPYGYHILMVTGIHPGKIKSLQEVTPQLTEELKKERAQKQFSELADSFSNLVYEQSTSLKPVVDKLKLQMMSSGWLTPFGAKEAGQYLNNPKLLKAIFSPESIKEGRNTQAVEVAPNVMVSAHVSAHEAQHDRPFAELKTTLIAMLQHEEEQKALAELGKERLESLNKGQALNLSWSKEQTLTRAQAVKVLPPAAVNPVFSTPLDHLPQYAGIATDSGYLLVKVKAVKEGGASSPDELKQTTASLEKNYTEGILESFVGGVESKKPLRILNKSILDTQQRQP